MVALFVGMLAMLIATVALPSAAGAQTTERVVPVTGELSDGGTFDGKIKNPDVFFNEATGKLRISGLLVGTVTKADNTTEQVREQFATNLRVSQQQECEILTLDIGRIFLDLLGLQVDIAPISIDVTAVCGAGNLLGNLLCAVAGLLDSNSAFADFLDDLLAALFTRG